MAELGHYDSDGYKYTPKVEKAESDAKKKYDASVKSWEEAKSRYSSAKQAEDKAKAAYQKSKKAKDLKKYNDAKKHTQSMSNAVSRTSSAKNEAQNKYNNVRKEQQKVYDEQLKSALDSHDGEWKNEGKTSIYPTEGGDGTAGEVVWFAPINTESESNSTNITSYPVDVGAPRKDYARVNSRTIQIDGLLSDTAEGTAFEKFQRLMSWNENHVELTYNGDIYYDNLEISEIGRQYTGNTNTLQVSITFTYVRDTEVTTISGKRNKGKSSKTTRGKRNKNYTAITIKKGDTLWGLSKKYGKSISWLKRVNHIKNVNLIYAGNLLYVNDKKHKAKSKVRVK